MYIHKSKLIYLQLFTELFHKDVSSFIRTNTENTVLDIVHRCNKIAKITDIVLRCHEMQLHAPKLCLDVVKCS